MSAKYKLGYHDIVSVFNLYSKNEKWDIRNAIDDENRNEYSYPMSIGNVANVEVIQDVLARNSTRFGCGRGICAGAYTIDDGIASKCDASEVRLE